MSLSALPKFFWVLPLSSSARPLMCSLALSVASPRSPRICPFISLPVPLTWFSRPLSFKSFIEPSLCNSAVLCCSPQTQAICPQCRLFLTYFLTCRVSALQRVARLRKFRGQCRQQSGGLNLFRSRKSA